MPKQVFFFLALIYSITAFAQSGQVTGVLTDDDNLPLPGVSVIVRGKSIGTQTDFDGNYSINCQIGDVLIYSYIGMKTREVKVTASMFIKQEQNRIKNQDVAIIVSDYYSSLLAKQQDSTKQVFDFEKARHDYNKKDGYLQIYRIKDIAIDSSKIRLDYFQPDVFFEVAYDHSINLQFIRQHNLLSAQTQFSQGRPFNGQAAWFGADTNEQFSFGSPIANLEFDGTSYPFDQNGRLVSLGNGNGNRAIVYNNGLFKNAINIQNDFKFKVFTNKKQLSFHYKNLLQKDIFNIEKSKTNKFNINYNRTVGSRNKLNLGLSYFKSSNGQPDINGFYSNVLLNNFVTPPTFGNVQNSLSTNENQHSFNPSGNNNPLRLLGQNGNNQEVNNFKANANFKLYVFEDASVTTSAYIEKQDSEFQFLVPVSTVSFEDGYLSTKAFEELTIGGNLKFNYDKHINNYNNHLKIVSEVGVTSDKLDYTFLENNGSTTFSNIQNRNNSLVNLINKVQYEIIPSLDAELTLQNNAVSSNIQGDEWFLPSIQLYAPLDDLIGRNGFISNLSVAVGYGTTVDPLSLFYNNNSHNSLAINPEELQGLTANNDLFISPDLAFEKSNTFELETQFGFFDRQIEVGFRYYDTTDRNVIFPVQDNSTFQLQNLAKIRNNGIEANINFRFGRYWDDHLTYEANIVFSSSRGKVISLANNQNNIPIAGFSSISKNLIVGKQPGVLLGSSFLRNDSGQQIIGADGFPLVDPNSKIIGNPNPDFTLGFSNTFSFKKFQFNVLIDIQKGGQVWNGSQNVLNYYGTSQESANLRNTTNFIFEGIQENGNVNTIPVDFANPNNDVLTNRWTRYGFAGVAEEAIEDASYINLRSLSLSYHFITNENRLVRDLKLTVFAKNLFTNTQFEGANPYGSLFGYQYGTGLNLFNTPLTSEVGVKLNIKI